MPRPPNPAVRARLLDAGGSLVHRHGFNGCGVQDIAEAAEVPKGSFYNYFDSKSAFASELLERYWQSIWERHGPLLRDPRTAPLGRLRRFFHGLSRDHRENAFVLGCLIGNLSLELAASDEHARGTVLDVLQRWQAALAACLEEARTAGELGPQADTAERAALLVESYEGAVLRSKVERSGKALERFEKVVLPSLLS